MKYVLILGDGMSDYPIEQLNNKTPLQCAKKPNIDFLAQNAEVGMVKTVPEGLPPGSDVANLSVMGYNPLMYYTGRSPLEAVSMGIKLSATDVTLRCNLVTLSHEGEYKNKVMVDYSSDEISSEEAKILIEEINTHFKTDKISFYPGISYRHCMVWDWGFTNLNLTPPHDILDKKIGNYLPENKMILDMMVKSYDILKDHPVNKKRISKGLKPANSIWLWGEGKKPNLPKFYDMYKIQGSVVSAVDLIKGIGILAGLNIVEVEGATGNIHTNFKGKALAALEQLESGRDFVYLHIEAPDECGHRYEIENKVRAIELIDEEVVGTILNGLQKYHDYKILILPDHPTPLSLRTHTSEPVPYLLYQKSKSKKSGLTGYDEVQAASTNNYIDEGYKLMKYFILNDKSENVTNFVYE
ncbi:cofactor-independent phosphoglycerate mutase [Acetivibrio saccincola]|jgi:2,3-bisphosphoglycerate-independent phosphoglycerate mutase|uniref:Cofactor-independent phosphoglycerate mutase n=1 Tax=Acetivibrio saccincola TaxID=1677857 RepID=A0A2K9E934_9FIRM|nr:cofactor-independent phosphoglycerate mutase [Acetivibrio saccincola]AUG58116.1 cofactor-independent phosphoglycerate mutase [Acetivibrio saccincola]NLW27812.1 cofactor-independent phosphoglycerate mutase [Acetivibrio saccincola]PQQ67999.1 cofactor-independent phosphoglycerate mutase [Acetivibrio saccincola]HOA97790.1 cofactor-independent phosphoglycerate mutase [Acetivibrio saccincola]HQD29187.1 cofactor-independent phosphoglycerate mutase [Acetivibrio saccincola]